MNRLFHHSRFAPAFMLLVAFALMVRAAIPAGFMPGVGQDGFAQIVICSGMEEKTISVPLSDTQSEGGHDSTDHAAKACTYQISTGQKDITVPAIALIAAPVITAVVHAAIEAPHKPSATIHALSARGPPRLT